MESNETRPARVVQYVHLLLVEDGLKAVELVDQLTAAGGPPRPRVHMAKIEAGAERLNRKLWPRP